MRCCRQLGFLLVGLILLTSNAAGDPVDHLSEDERIAYAVMHAELTHLKDQRGSIMGTLCVGLSLEGREIDPSPDLMDALKAAYKTAPRLILVPRSHCVEEPYGVASRSLVIETGARAFKFIATHRGPDKLRGWGILGSASIISYAIEVENGRIIPTRGPMGIF